MQELFGACTYQAGKGLHDERGAHDQQQVAGVKVGLCQAEEALWEPLPKEDYVRLDLHGEGHQTGDLSSSV